jgi:hypothetical protein
MRNDMQALSIEHKMGVHCSPTCVMSYGDQDGAIAYLMGSEGSGLACMFMLMNRMRLGVGLHAVGVAQRACQHAVGYARERVQGRIPGRGEVKIIEHGDVRRMLLTMHSLTLAARSIVLETAAALDVQGHAADEARRAKYQLYTDLLTPVVKGWCSEVAQEVTYLGVQVFGGAGFIEETGVAQLMRDGRVLSIFEGTNGIQALDLVARKILKQGDAGMRAVFQEIRDMSRRAPAALSVESGRLMAGVDLLEQATDWVLEHASDNPNTVSAVAFNYLMLTGTVFGGWLLLRHAAATLECSDNGGENYLLTTRFYLEQIMPRALTYSAALLSGGQSIINFPESMF